ncbi:IS110 family transposase [Salinispora cortesiana]|uniref:IS110 family transposase n=1 Tax=Salinispora cortesiana TaxID=1305843 RepID=UPI00042619D7|nr:IS110 family transposase [Salinispora cortesiana]
MALVIGVDIAKEFHWVAAVVAETGQEVVSRRVDNDPEAIAVFLTELAQAVAEHGPVTIGIDVLGGIAGLLTAMLLDSGHRVVYVPGLTVNRSRHGTRGGEHKSDPRDARVIASQLRLRDDWRPVAGANDLSLDLRLLVSRRSDLVTEQTRRINRTRDMLTGIFPGLERVLDLTNLGDLRLLARYATPGEIRRAGKARIAAHLNRNGVRSDRANRLAATRSTPLNASLWWCPAKPGPLSSYASWPPTRSRHASASLPWTPRSWRLSANTLTRPLS